MSTIIPVGGIEHILTSNKRLITIAQQNNQLMGDGIMQGVGTCHGMSLQATGDGTVGTRHGVSPPHVVSFASLPFRETKFRFGFSDYQSTHASGKGLAAKNAKQSVHQA